MITEASWNVLVPFQDPPLNLNRKLQHHERGAITARVRTAVTVLAKHLHLPLITRATVGLTWYPGRNVVADADNIAPSLKPMIDGLRDAGVFRDDDSATVLMTWQRVVILRDDPYAAQRGRLVLTVTRVADEFALPHYAPGRPGELTSGMFGAPAGEG